MTYTNFHFSLFSIFTADNLLVIGGQLKSGNGKVLRAEWVRGLSDDKYNPSDLIKVTGHATAISSDGDVITCGGTDKNINTRNTHMISKCQIKTSTGKTRSFPSMVNRRRNFGMVIVKDRLFAIAGYRTENKMETINEKNGTQWIEESKMPFKVYNQCVVAIGTKIFVIEGTTSSPCGVS